MADIPTQPSNGTTLAPEHHGILDKTLGEVLKSNPQAQGVVTQAMHISPERLQQMLGVTGDNPIMNTKIRDLFANGTVQQALNQQGQNAQQVIQIDPNQIDLTPEQKAQLQSQQPVNIDSGQQVPQQSLLQKVRNILGL